MAQRKHDALTDDRIEVRDQITRVQNDPNRPERDIEVLRTLLAALGDDAGDER